MWVIRSPATSRTSRRWRSPVGSRSSTAGVPLTQVAVADSCRSATQRCWRNATIAAPPTTAGWGGIVITASSRSSATSAVDVGALPGVDVAAQQLALRPRGRARPTRAGASASIVARARCSALLTAATVVSSSSATSVADPAEHVAQDQHRALAAGQPLDRGQERELHALAQRVARGGIGDRRDGVLQALVRIRLDDRLGAPRPALELVEAGVGRDPVQPGLRPRSAARSGRASATRAGASPARRPRRRGRAEHPVAVHLERAAVRLDERAEGALVARLGRRHVRGDPR